MWMEWTTMHHGVCDFDTGRETIKQDTAGFLFQTRQ
jgi:hypothetical protein